MRKICQNTRFLWSVFSRVWAESYPFLPVFGQNRRICPNTAKNEYDSVHMQENMDQKWPYFGAFHTVESP